MTALVAQRLTLWRGTNCLFEELSFTAAAGDFIQVQGPNGSGKTTLLRVLAGLTRPEYGSVEWNGRSIESERQPFAAQLAYFGHANALKADLTVRQNLTFFAHSVGQSATQIDPLLETLDLMGCRDLPVRLLSAGQKRRSALVRVFLAKAVVWLLDEPLTNLDAGGRSYVKDVLREHTANGGILIAATHEPIAGSSESQTSNPGVIVLGDDA